MALYTWGVEALLRQARRNMPQDERQRRVLRNQEIPQDEPTRNVGPFSERSYADYVEMVNQTLDNIPLVRLSDFNKVVTYLECLLSDRNTLSIEESNLQDAFEPLLDYLDDDNSEEYNAIWGFDSDEKRLFFIEHIVKSCINRKVVELKALTDSECLARIAEQSNRRELGDAYQDRVRDIEPPEDDSDAHVVSYVAMLNEMQERLQEGDRVVLRGQQNFHSLLVADAFRAARQPGPVVTGFINLIEVFSTEDVSEDLIRPELTHRFTDNVNRYGFFSALFYQGYESIVEPTVNYFRGSNP